MTTPSSGKEESLLPKWRERIQGLNNVPYLFKMVWEAAPAAVASSLFLRLIISLIPVAMLAITRVIIDSIYALTSQHRPLPELFWWLVALEFALASLGDDSGAADRLL